MPMTFRLIFIFVSLLSTGNRLATISIGTTFSSCIANGWREKGGTPDEVGPSVTDLFSAINAPDCSKLCGTCDASSYVSPHLPGQHLISLNRYELTWAVT